MAYRIATILLCVFVLTEAACAARSFGESPLLAGRVAAGLLPPVQERLPVDPPVVRAEGEIGRYGGTLKVITSQVNELSEVTWMVRSPLLRFAVGGRTPVPHVARNWQMTEDGRSVTIFLHEGMRWSDGVPVTVDDVEFAFNDVMANEELFAVPPSSYTVDGELMKLGRIDDYTFRFRFKQPYGGCPFALAHSVGGNALLMPKHYLEKCHQKYADEEELEARIKAADFDKWYELFLDQNFTIRSPSTMTPPEYPTLEPWQVSRVQAEDVTLERTPITGRSIVTAISFLTSTTFIRPMSETRRPRISS
jgi:peptide/nickel transport system substrate-binding protein